VSIFSSNIGIFYPAGEPISPHLLCYSAIAVEDHSFMRCASHLQQSRLVNNPVLFLLKTRFLSNPKKMSITTMGPDLRNFSKKSQLSKAL
jgi:hypothetical protein